MWELGGELGILFGQMIVFSCILWVAAEVIGEKVFPQKDETSSGRFKVGVAMLFGTLGGVLLSGTHLVKVPLTNGEPHPNWDMAFMAFFGLVCAVVASKFVNDKIMDRILKKST